MATSKLDFHHERCRKKQKIEIKKETNKSKHEATSLLTYPFTKMNETTPLVEVALQRGEVNKTHLTFIRTWPLAASAQDRARLALPPQFQKIKSN
jgi:uncharacterized membrane protein